VPVEINVAVARLPARRSRISQQVSQVVAQVADRPPPTLAPGPLPQPRAGDRQQRRPAPLRQFSPISQFHGSFMPFVRPSCPLGSLLVSFSALPRFDRADAPCRLPFHSCA